MSFCLGSRVPEAVFLYLADAFSAQWGDAALAVPLFASTEPTRRLSRSPRRLLTPSASAAFNESALSLFHSWHGRLDLPRPVWPLVFASRERFDVIATSSKILMFSW